MSGKRTMVISGVLLGCLGIVAIVWAGNPVAVRIHGLDKGAQRIEASFIVVEYDAYRFPTNCQQYTTDIGFNFRGPRVDLAPAPGVTATQTDFMTVLELDADDELAETNAFEFLRITAEDCARIQERRYDADYDEFIGPGDMEGHARPEDDREPRGTADDSVRVDPGQGPGPIP